MSKRRRKGERRTAPAAAATAPTAAVVEASREPPERARRNDNVCLAAVVLLSLVVYANVLGNGLVYDGLNVLTNVPNVRDPLDLRAVFLEPYRIRVPTGPNQPGAYRPLMVWSLAWTYAANDSVGLGGSHPTAHHLLDVLLFASVSGLVFILARSVLGASRLPALVSAALFAVHPIHTEAVASVVGRAELLAALFGLLFLLAHARGGRPWACAPLYGAALLGKESAAGFLVVVLAHDLLIVPSGTWRQRLRNHASYVLTVFLWWALRAKATGGGLSSDPSYLDNVLAHVNGFTGFLTALRVQFDYLRLQVFPVGLSSDYSFPQIRPVERLFDARVLGFVAVFCGASTLAWRTRESRPRVTLAVLGYAALLAPASNLLIKIGTIMGERLAFVPSIFFCLLVGEAFDALRARARSERRVLAVAILGAFALLTIQRNHVWSDLDRFSRACVQNAPRSSVAHYFEAQRRRIAGDRERAVFHFRRAYELYPGCALGVAVGLEQVGETEMAAALYRTVLHEADARERLVALLVRTGRFQEAVELTRSQGASRPR